MTVIIPFLFVFCSHSLLSLPGHCKLSTHLGEYLHSVASSFKFTLFSLSSLSITYLDSQQARIFYQSKSRIKEQYKQRVQLLLFSELNASNLLMANNKYAPTSSDIVLQNSQMEQTKLEEILVTTLTMLTKTSNHHPKSSTIRRGLIYVDNLHAVQVIRLSYFFVAKAQLSELHSVMHRSDRNYSPLNLNDALSFSSHFSVMLRNQWSLRERYARHYK